MKDIAGFEFTHYINFAAESGLIKLNMSNGIVINAKNETQSNSPVRSELLALTENEVRDYIRKRWTDHGIRASLIKAK